jgi:nucleoside-diphosphate-sugar epimerase
MNILLIGGTGFIGKYVIEQLIAAGHEVTVLHRGNTTCSISDDDVHHILADANRLSEFRAHLSKLAPDVAVNFILSSARQAREMMNALRGIARRVVVLSSMDVYRACGVLHETESGGLQELPLTEESELRTQPAYTPQQMEMGKTLFAWIDENYEKIAVEHIALSDSELPATVLRLPMIYGPGDHLRFNRFYPVIKRIQDRREKILFEEDAARWRASKGYVENIAAAIVLAATSDAAIGHIYNVAEEDVLSELEWARLIAAEMGWEGEFVVLPTERTPTHLRNPGNLKQHWVASSRRLRRELDYREQIIRTEGVRRTIEWEIRHPPADIPHALFDYAAEDAA